MLDVGECLFAITDQKTPKALARTLPMMDNPRTRFYSDVLEDKARRAVSKLVPQSVRSFGETVTKAGWRTIPATYIVCTSDQSLPPDLQEIFAVRAAAVERMDSGHSLPSIPCLVNSRASSTGWHWLLSATELLSTENKEKDNETTRRSTRRLWRP